MIKIITAIGNEELNNILKKQKNIIIENPDIQYQEGIIEALEKYPDTNMIILSENIIGNLKIEELIQNIIIIKNNIKIILLCKEKIYLEDENLIKVIKYEEDYLNIILKFFSDEKEIKNEINIKYNNLKEAENKNYKKEINNKNNEPEIKDEEKNLNKKIENINLKKETEKNFDEEKIKKEIQELKNYKNKITQKNNNKNISIKNIVNNKNNILKKIIDKIKNKLIKKQKSIITIIGCSGVRKNNFYFNII